VSLAQHRSESNEHYTPRPIVEAARGVLGVIDFDPFSCATANQVVQARAFCALPLDGFACDWSLEGQPTRAFVNPPGGKLDRKTLKPTKAGGKNSYSSAAVAWAKLMHEYETGNVSAAVFIGFNLEVLRTSQGWKDQGIPGAGSFPLCFPDERLNFWSECTAEDDSDPTCANVIVYVPPKGEHEERAIAFRDWFEPFGTVRV